jgi:hypothetical protein
MTRSKTYVWVWGGLAAVALVAIPVYAHCGKCAADCKTMVKAMETGKVTLASAITAAEAKSSGKAVAAVSELEDGKLEIAVYCLVGDKIMEVEVDATGKAVGMEEAKTLPGEEAAPAAKPEKPKPKPGG